MKGQHGLRKGGAQWGRLLWGGRVGKSGLFFMIFIPDPKGTERSLPRRFVTGIRVE